MAIVPASVAAAPAAADHHHRSDGWRAGQGARWAQRNPQTPDELDWSYTARFGVSRSDLAREFLGPVARTGSALEVGCSRGVQLEVLRRLGWRRLVGVDLSWAAVLGAAAPTAVADGLALPFRDGAFDMVFTSGTLMHVPPAARPAFAAELLRVTRRWVWGFELWAPAEQLWQWGTLLPDAWALPEPVSLLHVPGAPTRLARWRHFGHTSNGMQHAMYLVERLCPSS